MRSPGAYATRHVCSQSDCGLSCAPCGDWRTHVGVLYAIFTRVRLKIANKINISVLEHYDVREKGESVCVVIRDVTSSLLFLTLNWLGFSFIGICVTRAKPSLTLGCELRSGTTAERRTALRRTRACYTNQRHNHSLEQLPVIFVFSPVFLLSTKCDWDISNNESCVVGARAHCSPPNPWWNSKNISIHLR